MPDPLSIIRLAALLVFIGLVAVGLWLLDVAWWVVPPVMALALLIAWTIEWLAWRGTLTTPVVRQTATAPTAVAPAVEEPILPAEAIVPVSPAGPPASLEPEPAAVPDPPPAEPAGPVEAAADTEPAEKAPSEPERPVEEPPMVEAEPEKRPRRIRLRPVPPAAAERVAEAPPPPQPPESPVVAFRPRTAAPRSWNLWDLERIAREGLRAEPERRDEWAYLFLHLRQFASADGSLPAEFDGLVRESFGRLLERAPGA